MALSLGCCFVTSPAFAQKEPGKDAELEVGAGAVFQRMNTVDKNFSARSYNGNLYGAAATIRYQPQKARHQLFASYQAGTIKTDLAGVPACNASYLSIQYQLSYRLIAAFNEHLHVRGGIFAGWLYASRDYDGFINNSHTFESAISIGPSLEATYRPGENDHACSFTAGISAPFVTALAQPSFGNERTDGGAQQNASENFGKRLRAHKIESFAGFLRLTGHLSASRRIAPHHAIGIDYFADYYKVSGTREVRSVNNQLQLLYQYIF